MNIQSTMTADLFEDVDDTRGAIMEATYDALCEHGYADLTIQRIGDEFPKSKSLVYHHYDSKDDLLLDFLSFMLEEFETNVPREEYDDAAGQLRALFDHVTPDDLDEQRREFADALVELRAQAAHDPAYHEHFTRHSRFFHDRLTSIVERGVAEGVFRDVDPERVGWFLLAAIEGARFQRSTADVEVSIPAVRAELEAYIETRLIEAGETGE